MTATSMTVLLDVIIRKPVSVLVKAGLETLEDNACKPEDISIGRGGGTNRFSQI